MVVPEILAITFYLCAFYCLDNLDSRSYITAAITIAAMCLADGGLNVIIVSACTALVIAQHVASARMWCKVTSVALGLGALGLGYLWVTGETPLILTGLFLLTVYSSVLYFNHTVVNFLLGIPYATSA